MKKIWNILTRKLGIKIPNNPAKNFYLIFIHNDYFDHNHISKCYKYIKIISTHLFINHIRSTKTKYSVLKLMNTQRIINIKMLAAIFERYGNYQNKKIKYLFYN